MPVMTAAITTYRTVAMTSAARMPIGTVALRIACLLRGGGGLVEADVGEEDDRGARHDAAPAELAGLARVLRQVGMPVRGVDEGDADQR